ncbi:hypothetical protein HNO88_000006 [Novosphingobium chloroacetimidivorans]|uniref:Lipoprotein n=1 Tax=Novosphingobium chloroacetimidivorans TaxID=1428314 RepID=A0A7W7K5M8_9SPHN|nr:hypothetical protein [Novosphingobium chloroacetimidivorans]MBB4856709.1 hypothetical protein [Novosphingobium chloroacetimidivorans]
MRMGAAMALVALAALSACKREPTFDERYAGAQKAIRDKAGELDRDMSTRAAEASESAPDASGAAVDVVTES